MAPPKPDIFRTTLPHNLAIMATAEPEDLLTQEQKASLGPYVNDFRTGDRAKRADIVTKMAKSMYKPDDLPLERTRYFKVSLSLVHFMSRDVDAVFSGD